MTNKTPRFEVEDTVYFLEEHQIVKDVVVEVNIKYDDNCHWTFGQYSVTYTLRCGLSFRDERADLLHSNVDTLIENLKSSVKDITTK